MRKKVVAGNWKMNLTVPEGEALVRSLLDLLKPLTLKTEIIIAPAFTGLTSLSQLIKGSVIKLAAQNCSAQEQGAFTGEVSAAMIRSTGAEYVIIGHSERRQLFGERNDVLLQKIHRALSAQLHPIYCIGETLNERESNRQFDVVQQQLQEVLYTLSAADAAKLVLAYEPVWAIGTGKTASPQQAQEMHGYIRSIIAKKMGEELAAGIRILYGGSCNAQNASSLFAQPDVDGGLIGGASLKAEDLVNIIKAAN